MFHLILILIPFPISHTAIRLWFPSIFTFPQWQRESCRLMRKKQLQTSGKAHKHSSEWKQEITFFGQFTYHSYPGENFRDWKPVIYSRESGIRVNWHVEDNIPRRKNDCWDWTWLIPIFVQYVIDCEYSQELIECLFSHVWWQQRHDGGDVGYETEQTKARK